jgi:hypothetical protein
MSGPPETVRHFTDREVGLILKAAAELQQRAPEGGGSRGLSLPELEQIAAEAGIDPAHIRRAVAELDAQAGSGERNRFVGESTDAVFERTVDGEVSQAGMADVVDTIRRVTGNFGQVSTVGRALAWSVRRNTSFLSVTVTPRDGRTTIRIHEQLGELALSWFLGLFGVGGVLGGAVATTVALNDLLAPLAVAVGGAVLGGGYLAARLAYKAGFEGRRERLRQLTDAVAATVAERAAAEQTSPDALPPAGHAPPRALPAASLPERTG